MTPETVLELQREGWFEAMDAAAAVCAAEGHVPGVQHPDSWVSKAFQICNRCGVKL